MRKIIGGIIIFAGLMLLLRGHIMAGGLGSQITNPVTGATMDRALFWYIGGAALVVYGTVQLFWKRK